MGEGYLIDSNVIIDFFKKELPDNAKYLLFEQTPVISIITRIEIFCSSNIGDLERSNLDGFIKKATIFGLNDDIVHKTILLRITYKMKLPDAIIAATALHYNLTLITRNISDFSKVDALAIINPYTI